jgi:hypothetical protein
MGKVIAVGEDVRHLSHSNLNRMNDIFRWKIPKRSSSKYKKIRFQEYEYSFFQFCEPEAAISQKFTHAAVEKAWTNLYCITHLLMFVSVHLP